MTKQPDDGRRFQRLEEFLQGFVKELNDLSGEGGAVLVEGKRDVLALRGLGYSGPIFSISTLTSSEATSAPTHEAPKAHRTQRRRSTTTRTRAKARTPRKHSQA